MGSCSKGSAFTKEMSRRIIRLRRKIASADKKDKV